MAEKLVDTKEMIMGKVQPSLDQAKAAAHPHYTQLVDQCKRAQVIIVANLCLSVTCCCKLLSREMRLLHISLYLESIRNS